MSFPPHQNYNSSNVDWLGKVPSDWKITPLKSIARVVNGYPFASERFSPDGQWPLIRIRDLNASEPATYFDGAFVAQAAIDNNDILIGMDGDFSVGRWMGSTPALLNQRMCAVRADDDATHRFLFYALPIPLQAINTVTYATTVKHLSSSQVSQCRFAIPPADQLRQIADFLDFETTKIDVAIAAQERLIELLVEKSAATISRAISKGLNFDVPYSDSRLDWLGQIPAHWLVQPIRKLARLESGHTPSRSKPEYWIEEDCTIPWVTTGDVKGLRDGRAIYLDDTAVKISATGLANSSARLLPANTVFLSRTASVGFSGIMGREMAVSQDFAAWICGTELLPEYLLFCLRSMQPLFQSLMIGSTHKTIYMPDIEKLMIPVPPMEEQRKIASRLIRDKPKTEQLIDRARESIELLRERRSALITAAVTGKIDVRGHAQNNEREAA